MRLNRTVLFTSAAAGWAVLEMASIAIHPAPDLGATSETLQSFLASAEPARYETATTVHLVALGMLVVAATGLWEGLRRRGAPTAAHAAAMTALGVCIAAYLTGRVLVDGVLQRAADEPPAGVAHAMLDAGAASMWLGTAVLGAFGLATAAGIRGTDSAARWLSVSGAVIGVALVPALPLARSGYAHFASLAMMLWIIVATYRCCRTTGTPSPDPESEVSHR